MDLPVETIEIVLKVYLKQMQARLDEAANTAKAAEACAEPLRAARICLRAGAAISRIIDAFRSVTSGARNGLGDFRVGLFAQDMDIALSRSETGARSWANADGNQEIGWFRDS